MPIYFPGFPNLVIVGGFVGVLACSLLSGYHVTSSVSSSAGCP